MQYRKMAEKIARNTSDQQVLSGYIDGCID
jgi:hypothetical protein